MDNGSQDETLHLLKTVAHADARIRVLCQRTGGIVAALQLGCAAARGAFIARMDADDLMTPDRMWCQAEFLDRQPHLGVASCRVRFGGDRGTQAGYAAHVDWINSLLSPEVIAQRRFVESPVAHPSVMFRPKKIGRMIGGRSVVGPDQLPAPDRAFIIGGVSKRGARDMIAGELHRRGRAEGKDYLLAA